MTHRRSLAFDPIASTTFPLNVLFCFEKSSDRLFVSAHREESPISSATPSEKIGVKSQKLLPITESPTAKRKSDAVTKAVKLARRPLAGGRLDTQWATSRSLKEGCRCRLTPLW